MMRLLKFFVPGSIKFAMASLGRIPSLRTSGARFTATRWSVVLAAADHQAGTKSRRALDELIRAYWFPLYAFVRRQGEAPDMAEDVIQEFFARMLEKDFLGQIDPINGKFRSFLLAAVKHFLSNERRKRRAQKRGSGLIIALDSLDAEARYAVEPIDNMTPERFFERQWALAVLEQVLSRLRAGYAAEGKGNLYEAIAPCLTQEAYATDYDKVSRELGATEGAIRMAVHRLRRRYRDWLREEIAQTVDSPEQVEEELKFLLNCL